ncbi:MAG TPA: lysylphosphatidylglycerol synthase transmembrane domain-containing protein [Elusimicrobiales bacterium]|nr:lysylphosphatidylglycerol synthase transmembrane domain-containing protein [Elusimicrobiales bacterium]
MRKFLPAVIGFCLSGLLLYFAFRNVDLKVVTETFAKVKYVHLFILAGAVCLDMCIRGFRWKILLSKCCKTSTWQMTKLEAIGLALNNILPLRLGEFSRAWLGAHILKVPFATVLSTVLVERILDLITLAILLLVSTQFNGISWIKEYNLMLWVILAAVIIMLVLFTFMEDALNKYKMCSDIAGKFPRIKKILCQISVGAQSFKNKKLMLSIISSGFCLWLVDGFIYWFATRSMNIEPLISYSKSIVLLCAAAVAVSLPAVPGYFGTFEAAIQHVLVNWQVDKSVALAYAGYVHLIFYFVMTIAGIIFLYRMGNTLPEMWKRFKNLKFEQSKN